MQSSQCEVVKELGLSEFNLNVTDSLHALEAQLRPAMNIELTDSGFMQAITRAGQDSTNYNAVWVRDSMWGYLALQKTEPHKSRKLLDGIVRYFGTSDQRKRIQDILVDPQLARHPVSGAMSVPHIRFDGGSPNLKDVQVEGADQKWNHKQNDALGLFFFLWLREIAADSKSLPRWSTESIASLARFPDYWARTEYWNFPDAGAWEEIERVNSSSIGFVVNALETLVELHDQGSVLEEIHTRISPTNDLPSLLFFSRPDLEQLIERGYQTLRAQLPFESPSHCEDSPYYRQADAALLGLIYPCTLKRLSFEDKLSILEVVSRLVRPIGVIRYLGDSYQSGNYWRKASTSFCSTLDSRSDDASGEKEFALRSAQMIPDTEAEWFFDSWMSLAWSELYFVTRSSTHLNNQIKHLKRALSQLTPSRNSPSLLCADGSVCPAWSLPESYNVLVDGNKRTYAPSPMTPLNWAKASLRLAIAALKVSLETA